MQYSIFTGKISLCSDETAVIRSIKHGARSVSRAQWHTGIREAVNFFKRSLHQTNSFSQSYVRMKHIKVFYSAWSSAPCVSAIRGCCMNNAAKPATTKDVISLVNNWTSALEQVLTYLKDVEAPPMQRESAVYKSIQYITLLLCGYFQIVQSRTS